MKAYNLLKNLYSVKSLFTVILTITILTGCKKDEITPDENKNTYLVKSQLIATANKSQILLVVSLYPEIYDKVSQMDLLSVNVYKLSYNTTDVEGNDILASGAVIVPITDKPLPLLSYQHGSLFNLAEAPSMYSIGIETRGLATFMASAGYAVSVPDYLGYGESSSYPHPYEHANTLASASYDMLMATKEFLKDNKIVTSDKLFLTGYSEGGNATMALHKYIEENTDLVVTMSAPASGAYNKTAFAKRILEINEDLDFLPRFMWVIDSYNWIYGLDRPWSAYVNEPYAASLEAVNSPLNLADLNINHNPQLLFTTSMIEGVLNSTDSEFLSALSDNDIFNWKPKFPVTLYYGTADDYVFPLNSETAYDAMLAKGASITKKVYQGANHNIAVVPYMMDMFDLFETLK